MRKHNINFRYEDISYIFNRWQSSESISLVGVGSIGKSNLLRHLIDIEIQATYLNNKKIRAIIIDPFLLGPLPSQDSLNYDQFICWAGIELIMHRLYMTFFPFNFLSEQEAQQFFDLYNMMQSGKNPLYAYMGLRYLELALKLLFDNGIKLVLLFDEFEEFLRRMPYHFFQILRGLRDNYKEEFSFVTFSRSSLVSLVEKYELNYLTIEPFIELFRDNVRFIGPYNELDANDMWEALLRRNPDILKAESNKDFIFYITGCFAGLLRASFKFSDNITEVPNSDENTEKIIQKLAMQQSIKHECETIWFSLPPVEQNILRAVAHLTTYTSNQEYENALKTLIQKKLLLFDLQHNILTITPPLFRCFVQNNPE